MTRSATHNIFRVGFTVAKHWKRSRDAAIMDVCGSSSSVRLDIHSEHGTRAQIGHTDALKNPGPEGRRQDRRMFGLAYTFALADELNGGDSVLDAHAAKRVVDAKSLAMIDGVRLDFVTEGLKQDFQFERTDKPVWFRSATRTVGCIRQLIR